MKNFIYVLIASFIFSSNIFSGDVSRQGTTGTSTFFLSSGYGIQLLNSLGNSGLMNSTANLGFMNPASIVDLPNYSIGLSYQASTTVYFPEPNDDISMPRVYNFIPQSFGAVCHFDDLSFGLSLGQEVNTAIDFGEIPITTPEFPDGTGTVYTPIIENQIENYSLSFAYNLGKAVLDDVEVSLGFRFSLNRLHGYEKLLEFEANRSIFASSFDAGINILFVQMQFGMSFNSGKSFIDLIEEHALNNLGSPSGTYEIAGHEIEYSIPSEVNFDALFQLESDLQLTAAINNIFWSSVNSFISNQLDVSSNLIYNFSNFVTGSTGLLLSNCFIDQGYGDNEYNALFIMAGLRLNYETFNIDFALADSHLISGDLRKQLIAKVGVGIIL